MNETYVAESSMLSLSLPLPARFSSSSDESRSVWSMTSSVSPSSAYGCPGQDCRQDHAAAVSRRQRREAPDDLWGGGWPVGVPLPPPLAGKQLPLQFVWSL